MSSEVIRMKYSSKVDWWLAAILLLALGGELVVALTVHTVWAWVPLISTLALYACLLWPVAYTLEADALEIRSGLTRMKIPYAAIESVEPTRNPLSAPALSLDRLAIRYSGGQLALISPKDKAAFIQKLSVRIPGLSVLPR
jgi:membrane protein YdbS with pleckstrin-like domain